MDERLNESVWKCFELWTGKFHLKIPTHHKKINLLSTNSSKHSFSSLENKLRNLILFSFHTQDVARLIAECYANRDRNEITFLVVEAKKSNLEPKPTALVFLEQ